MILDYIPAGIRKKIAETANLIRARPWNCDAPAAVQLQAVGKGLGDAATVLLSFGLNEVLKSWMRPRGIGGRSHVPTRSSRRSNIGIPEVGNELGRMLQHATGTVHHISAYGPLAPLVYAGFKAWDLVSRAGWYLLLLEAARAGLKGWVTTLADAGYCRVHHLPRSLHDGRIYRWDPGIGYRILWQPTRWNHQFYRPYPWHWYLSGPHTEPAPRLELSCRVTVQAPPNIPLRTRVTTHLRSTHPPRDYIKQFEWTTPRGDTSSRHIHRHARAHVAMLSVVTWIPIPWPWPDPGGSWVETVGDVLCVTLDA